jgi:hypothetical protein
MGDNPHNGNGHGENPEAAVRANIMLVATRDFECEYDGKRIELKAGLDRVGGDHELAARFPENFRPVERGQHGQRGVEYRMVDGRALRHPARTMSLEDELRVRRTCLAEIERGERTRTAAATRDAEAAFWKGVDELLGTARQEREDKRQIEILDALHATRARSLGAELEDLASWLEGE